MKVKELIKILGQLDQEKTILLSKDEEGNGFGHVDTELSNVENKAYVLYPFSEKQSPEELI